VSKSFSLNLPSVPDPVPAIKQLSVSPVFICSSVHSVFGLVIPFSVRLPFPIKVGTRVENIKTPSSSNNPASSNSSSDMLPLLSSSSNCFDITHDVTALSALLTISKVADREEEGASKTASIVPIISSICTTNSLILTNKSEYLVVINNGRPKPGGTDCGIGSDVITTKY